MAFQIESEEYHAIEYESEPLLVAETIQEILYNIGEITHVNRETGIIEGKIFKGLMAWQPAKVRINITKNDNGIKIDIRTYRQESALINYHGAQKAMNTLLSSLADDERLKSNSKTGW